MMFASIFALASKLPWKWICIVAAVLGLLWGVEHHGRSVQHGIDDKAFLTLQDAFTKERQAFATERGLFLASEAARKRESGVANKDASTAAAACDARIAEARRSAGAVAVLVNKELPRDPATHCPVVRLYPRDELCHALGGSC